MVRRTIIILYALSYSRFQVTEHTKDRLERGGILPRSSGSGHEEKGTAMTNISEVKLT